MRPMNESPIPYTFPTKGMGSVGIQPKSVRMLSGGHGTAIILDTTIVSCRGNEYN